MRIEDIYSRKATWLIKIQKIYTTRKGKKEFGRHYKNYHTPKKQIKTNRERDQYGYLHVGLHTMLREWPNDTGTHKPLHTNAGTHFSDH